MKHKAITYYRQGYNCSECILKALEYTYQIPINRQSLNMCNGISNGFGVGSFCSALIAGIMSLGIVFDENMVKKMRLLLIEEFKHKYKDYNCSLLKKGSKNDYICEEIIGDVAEIVGALINEYKR